MKKRNKKKAKGSIFSLLIKNYMFLTMVIIIIIMMIISLSNAILNRKANYTRGLNYKDEKILNEESFNKLNIKSIAGRGGIIEVLDQNNNVIYNSSGESNSDYSDRELGFIKDYNDLTNIKVYDFKNKANEDRKLLIENSFIVDDDGYYIEDSNNIKFEVLDSDLNVIYSDRKIKDNITSYTKEELGYLTGTYPEDQDIMKYKYTNNNGDARTVLIKSKRISDLVLLETMSNLIYISTILFIVSFIFCIIIFGILLRKKVQVPLKKLNRAIKLLSEDNSYEPINYRGPKEFVEICDSFNVMLNKLQTSELDRNKLIKDKQSMLADISHDLKTPITTIQGYSKALAEGIISKEEYEKYFNIIYSKSKRLTELINIFYEYSKLEHPDFKLVLEEVDLSEYLRAYVASRYEYILESEFDIEVDIPEHILKYKIDKVQFQRALDNLLGNSIKHNPKNTKIYVGLKDEEDSYKIIVADTGVGIPKDIAENIFSPFIVGDESRNSKQGSGLGLAITKTIVEMHGGSIRLCNCEKNEYNTVFEINLPYIVNS